MNKNLHVVVLMGGWSAEREVSLMSGKGVVEALTARLPFAGGFTAGLLVGLRKK